GYTASPIIRTTNNQTVRVEAGSDTTFFNVGAWTVSTPTTGTVTPQCTIPTAGQVLVNPGSPPLNNELGNCPTCDGSAGAPINVLSGDTWISEQDYSLPGLAGGLTLARTWNSLWPNVATFETAGMFGHSWRSTYEERLQLLTGGVANYF